MNLTERIRFLLAKYIRTEVDQLCEGVVDWYDSSSVAGSEDYEYVWNEITVVYVVHPDVEPRIGTPNYRYHRWQASFGEVISGLTRVEEKADE